MSFTNLTSTRRPRVLALGKPEYVGDDYLAAFSNEFDYSVLSATNRQEVLEMLPECIRKDGPVDAFVIRMGTPPYEPFDEKLLSSLVPDCKIIVSASAGYNEFDIKWMAQKGIWFCNTIDAVAEATADMTIFLILAVLRNTTNAERSVRGGTWKQSPGLVPARDPCGLTLGIVGLGSVGKYVARKAAVFGMNIIYYNRHQLRADVEERYKVSYSGSLHQLLNVSDIVSINCPLTEHTKGLIGPREFSAMKDGVFLVNTARGPVVNETSLIDCLESGKVIRAGLDVFQDEPDINPYFRKSDRVIVQPHLGGLTDMAFKRAERECFENIRAFFQKGKPNSPVVDLSKEGLSET
ncbi:hypothetical protein CNMCM8927_000879 [Aspergillus lentulus]|uniref:2-hydroxyacid dehydrogenase UNK4.10 n=1 Tax=Aspergillus lentulus TaxID=293939 RepID=A0AAN5YJT2_ASPLE|nr:hypothetical protein CNMCM8927_000879 [Aspergillus lentulus]